MQPRPNYPSMTVVPHGVISRHLLDQYADSVCWPVIWYDQRTLEPQAITFEVNAQNIVNKTVSAQSPVFQTFNLPAFKIDYLRAGHPIVPLTSNVVPSYLRDAATGFSRTYDYITSRSGHIKTIDIDYLWWRDRNVGLEVSTFYKPMFSREEAMRLVGYFVEKRAARSTQSHQFKVLARTAQLLETEMKMVFVNTSGRSEVVIADGNSLWFPLDAEQAERLHQGLLPNRVEFGTLQAFLAGC